MITAEMLIAAQKLELGDRETGEIFLNNAEFIRIYEVMRNAAPRKTTVDLVHLALDLGGFVVAQFVLSDDAAAYCRKHGYTHVPFKSRSHEVPAVGSFLSADQR